MSVVMRFVRPVVAALAAVCVLAFTALPASARLVIQIDKSSQRMTISLDGETIHHWPVSTGLRAYDTPSGSYTPFRLEEDHYSREWDDAPMPHSIFFTKKGHAIHGTTHLRNIGRPASHGCVRLEPENARVLFGLVKRHGLPNTRVVLTGEVPASAPAVARRTLDHRDRPTYVEPRDARQYDSRQYDPLRDDPPRASRQYGDRPHYPRQDAPRQGYWAQRPDGSLVFVEPEREYRQPLPPPPSFYGHRRWD
jgi:L,D-transpeptidase catalytic domain